MKRVLLRSTRFSSDASLYGGYSVGRFPLQQLHQPQLQLQQQQRQFGGASSSSSGSKNSVKRQAPPQQHSSHAQSQRNQNQRPPVVAYPQSPRKQVPSYIVRPPYADSGVVPHNPFETNEHILIHNQESIARMRTAAQLARSVLDLACSLAASGVGVTTDTIDGCVHEAILAQNAYPSPLNYMKFPKSLCTSVNEIICHGIPDLRPLQLGDVVSLDVSCYVFDSSSKIGVHGDNCATVIVGDVQETDEIGCDWRGVPYLNTLNRKPKEESTTVTDQQQQLHDHLVEARRLVSTTREALYAGIAACRPGGCLSDIGAAIEDVSDREGYSSVRKYRGHGIGSTFHCAPYVRHYRNDDKLELKPGMIFTIEPMITQGLGECYEWDDDWTVSTVDGGLAAQFEHTVLITDDGVEILTQL